MLKLYVQSAANFAHTEPISALSSNYASTVGFWRDQKINHSRLEDAGRVSRVHPRYWFLELQAWKTQSWLPPQRESEWSCDTATLANFNRISEWNIVKLYLVDSIVVYSQYLSIHLHSALGTNTKLTPKRSMISLWDNQPAPKITYNNNTVAPVSPKTAGAFDPHLRRCWGTSESKSLCSSSQSAPGARWPQLP